MQVIKAPKVLGEKNVTKFIFFNFCNNEQCLVLFYPALLDLDGRKKCLLRLQSYHAICYRYKDVPFIFMSLAHTVT